MSKALKVVAGVAALGAVIASGGSLAIFGTTVGASLFGVSAATFTAISIGASIGASLLTGKATAPPVDDGNRLEANINPRTPRKIAFGSTALATDIRDQEYTDGQRFLHRWIVCASHKIAGVREIWFDDKLAWTLAGGVQGEFASWLVVQVITEGSAANAINVSARMGSSRRYTGCAYVYFRYQLLSSNKKLESPFASSVPSRITIVGDGMLLYDPRMDGTVPGGSGPQRADDQSTWVWSDGPCNNPPLELLAYCLGWRINGLLAVGKGIPPARLDLESFAVAANICDELVSIPGGTEPRYRSAGVCSEGDSPTAVIDNLKATMNADLDDVGGKLRITIFKNDLADPIAAFDTGDVLGAFTWRPALSLDETFNVVRGTFTDPSANSLFQANDYPQVELPSPDGIDRILPLDLPFVQSVHQPQRLGNLRLQRQKIGGLFRAEFNARGWRAQKNAVVTLTFKPLGFVNKLFRVVELDHREDGVVPMLLREEHPDLYDPPVLQDGNVAVAPTPYDPNLSPISEALVRGALRVNSRSVEYPVTANDTAITVVAFTGRLDDGRSASFPAASIAAASGITWALFYRLSSETYEIEAYPADESWADSGLVFIGYPATSTDGTYPTQPTPPPSWGGDGPAPNVP